MAIQGTELSTNLVTGAFASATAGTAVRFEKSFNLSIWGTFVGTIALQRSFDQGTTWNTVAADAYGTAASWTAPVDLIIDTQGEQGVLYRLNCTAYTSGTANWRLSA